MKTPAWLYGVLFIAFLGFTGCLNKNVEMDGGIRLTLKFVNSYETHENIAKTLDILSRRLNTVCVAKPIVIFKPDSNILVVDLLFTHDSSRFAKLITNLGKIEFWETYENPDLLMYLYKANKKIAESDSFAMKKTNKEIKSVARRLKDKNLMQTDTEDEGYKIIRKYIKTDAEEKSSEELNKFPLFSVLRPLQRENGEPFPGPCIGYTESKDTAKVNFYLSMKQVRALFPENLKLLWSVKPSKYVYRFKAFNLYALKTNGKDEKAPLEGNVIINARQDFNRFNSQSEVTMRMNDEGTMKWAKLTRENIGHYIAIVVDNSVYSAPLVRSEIPTGNSQISGDFTVEEAKDLACLLQNDVLPAKIRISKIETFANKRNFMIRFIEKLNYERNN